VSTGTNEGDAFRTKALIGLVIALGFGVAGWVGLTSATQRGIDRLAAIDKARATCAISWNAARSRPETLMVDRIPLADTIDPRSEGALTRCGSLRNQGTESELPKTREMNGEPMPRGLR